MNREPNETLSAFLDGEPIDAPTLATALASPGGREALIDFVLLRGSVAEARDRPGGAFYERMQRSLAPRTARRSWWPAAAAAGLLFLATVGLWSLRPSRMATDNRNPASAPPAPTRTLHFERGVDWQGQG